MVISKKGLFPKLIFALCLLAGVALFAACGAPVTGSSADPTPGNTPIVSRYVPEPTVIPTPRAPSTMRFTHIGLPDGLSQSVVNCILQDQQGFLWIGTQDGLNRYDGYTFKVFTPDPNDPTSISDRWINTLFEDSQGYIWIGTRQGGLNRYDPQTGTFTRYIHDADIPNSLTGNRVQAIYEDHLGMLWIGTAQGLDRYSPAISGFKHYSLTDSSQPETRNDNITALFEDTSGTLWVGTSLGLRSYSRETDKFTAHPDILHDMNVSAINAIQESDSQEIWLATGHGLVLFDPASEIYTYLRHDAADPDSLASNTVRTIYVDQGGILWAGTNEGLDRYDPATGKFVHYQYDSSLGFSLSSNTVTTIYESADNILWVGTFGGGLNKYYRGQDRFSYYYNEPEADNALSDNLVQELFIDSTGMVWIGTLHGGLNALDPVSGEIRHYQYDPADPGSLMSDEVRAVYVDRAGTLWVGSAAGLDRLDPGAEAFTHYRSESFDSFHLAGAPVNDIFEDRRGNLWIATDNGLDLFDPQTETFTHYRPEFGNPASLSGYEITKIYEDRGGTLWVGTFNDGLNRFDPQTGLFTRFQHDAANLHSLSNNSILSIYQDKRGNLWVGTAGGGLNRYDPNNGTFIYYLENDGLPNNVINGILEDSDGFLWLSTNNGLSRFDVGELTFRNFTASDGLQGNEFSPNAYTRDAEGNLYFGGVNGITVFDPAQIVDSAFSPPIVLLSFTVDGQPVDTNSAPEMMDEVVIRWPWKYFEFEFAALSYAQSDENQYAYILENYDTSWHMIDSEHKGQYTNVPGGEYTLRLMGSNNDGLWNEVGRSIKVIIIPPFWETWLFRGAAIFGVLALVFTAYRMRVKSVETYNRQLERQVSDRTQEIEQLFEKTKELVVVKERNRLARELHDSAKQKAFAALAQLGTANGILPRDPRAARLHLTEAENLVYQVIEELTFLIQEMYPVGLKEKGLAASLREYVFEWESRTDIPAAVVIENERRLSLDVEQAIYRVIQESLSNVARHSQATHVQVTLIYRPALVESIILDNGCGFDPQTKAGGIGLRSIRERIESLGGAVEIESASHCGTRVTVHVPLKPSE